MQLIKELKEALLRGQEATDIKAQLLPLLQSHYEKVHSKTERLKPLLERRRELEAQQVRNARRTQLYNLNNLLDTKLSAKSYDLDTQSTLKVIIA